MSKFMLTAVLIAAGVLGLTGCEVKKTQEGKYEVTPADVKVGKTEKEVTVPTAVEMQKKTVEVPTLEVKTAKEKDKEPSTNQMGASGNSSK